MKDIDTPELDKFVEINHLSQSISEFIRWMASEKDIHFGKEHHHGVCCTEKHEHVDCCGFDCNVSYDITCGLKEIRGRLYHVQLDNEEVLAEFFDIDLVECEKERRAILDSIKRV